MIRVRITEDIFGDADLGTFRKGEVHTVTPEFATRFETKVHVIREVREVEVEGKAVRTAATRTPGVKR